LGKAINKKGCSSGHLFCLRGKIKEQRGKVGK
jgi:hypothetical protein